MISMDKVNKVCDVLMETLKVRIEQSRNASSESEQFSLVFKDNKSSILEITDKCFEDNSIESIQKVIKDIGYKVLESANGVVILKSDLTFKVKG